MNEMIANLELKLKEIEEKIEVTDLELDNLKQLKQSYLSEKKKYNSTLNKCKQAKESFELLENNNLIKKEEF